MTPNVTVEEQLYAFKETGNFLMWFCNIKNLIGLKIVA